MKFLLLFMVMFSVAASAGTLGQRAMKEKMVQLITRETETETVEILTQKMTGNEYYNLVTELKGNQVEVLKINKRSSIVVRLRKTNIQYFVHKLLNRPYIEFNGDIESENP